MNIDKFGHHVHKRLRLSEFTDILTNTLIRTDAGDFDLKSSRLKGLQSPEKDDEAVNKEYVDKCVQELKNEMKTIQSNIKKYLNNLEKLTTNNLSTLYYTKKDIDLMIAAKPSKNE